MYPWLWFRVGVVWEPEGEAVLSASAACASRRAYRLYRADDDHPDSTNPCIGPNFHKRRVWRERSASSHGGVRHDRGEAGARTAAALRRRDRGGALGRDDEACEVEVLGHREPTFCVARPPLRAGDRRRARARIDDGVRGRARRRAPLAGARLGVPAERDPDPRRRGSAAPGFGSCRVSLPHHGPYVLPKERAPDGREFDALYSLVEEMLRGDRSTGRRRC